MCLNLLDCFLFIYFQIVILCHFLKFLIKFIFLCGPPSPLLYLNEDKGQLTLEQEQKALSDACRGVTCLRKTTL